MNVKDAVHATVRAYPGGAEALAPRVGMTPGVLRNKANPNSDTHRTAIEEASAIMGVSGDFQILHALAAEHGFVCLRADDVGDCTAPVLDLILGAQAKEGTLSQTLLAALSDGVITPNELGAISGAAVDVQAAVINLVRRCAATVKKVPA